MTVRKLGTLAVCLLIAAAATYATPHQAVADDQGFDVCQVINPNRNGYLTDDWLRFIEIVSSGHTHVHVACHWTPYVVPNYGELCGDAEWHDTPPPKGPITVRGPVAAHPGGPLCPS